MALVTATRYNTLRQSITNVLETGSGDSAMVNLQPVQVFQQVT